MRFQTYQDRPMCVMYYRSSHFTNANKRVSWTYEPTFLPSKPQGNIGAIWSQFVFVSSKTSNQAKKNDMKEPSTIIITRRLWEHDPSVSAISLSRFIQLKWWVKGPCLNSLMLSGCLATFTRNWWTFGTWLYSAWGAAVDEEPPCHSVDLVGETLVIIINRKLE